MPPLPGPRTVLWWIRHPVNTSTEPSSRFTGTDDLEHPLAPTHHGVDARIDVGHLHRIVDAVEHSVPRTDVHDPSVASERRPCREVVDRWGSEVRPRRETDARRRGTQAARVRSTTRGRGRVRRATSGSPGRRRRR